MFRGFHLLGNYRTINGDLGENCLWEPDAIGYTKHVLWHDPA